MALDKLGWRVPDQQTLKEEVEAWEADRNKKHAKADSRFTTENARVKLKRCRTMNDWADVVNQSTWVRCGCRPFRFGKIVAQWPHRWRIFVAPILAALAMVSKWLRRAHGARVTPRSRNLKITLNFKMALGLGRMFA